MKTVGRLCAVLLAAAIGVVLVRGCWVSLIEIPEDGERPVFMAGDRVAMNRIAYGLRLSPMRWWGDVRWWAEPVPRGDWVAFNDPSAGEDDERFIDERDVFVGFCYAVPGDSLWIDSLGKVYRACPRVGRPCRVVELPRKNAYVTLTPDNMQWYCRMINLHEGVHAAIIHDSLCVSGHFVSSFRFTHDYYWMSSANERNHADSRTFGFVPDTYIIGRLSRILYSWDTKVPWYARFRAHRTMMKVSQENPNP
ncbi:signal peptidase I [Paraprevotella xylaniphila]|uniref:signal peptidase I n=1 Tax=Paraprevotella xylaniphila TaxID=454155 RepID=UPI0024A95276|nr:signal peptidase I [Paraprevotella xylaniphila]